MKYGNAPAWPAEKEIETVNDKLEISDDPVSAPVGNYGRKALEMPSFGAIQGLVHKINRTVAIVVVSLVVLISLGLYGLNQHNHLKSAQHGEAKLRSQLAKQKADNSNASTQINDLVAQLSQTTTELESTKTSLQGQLDARNADVAVLKTCIDGVTKAIVQATGNDLAGAQSTLAGVNDACTKAEKIS